MLGFDFFREKIDIFVLRELIKGAVEHGADIILAIINDLFRLFVPKHRHGHARFEIRIGRRVGFA